MNLDEDESVDFVACTNQQGYDMKAARNDKSSKGVEGLEDKNSKQTIDFEEAVSGEVKQNSTLQKKEVNEDVGLG